MNLNEVVPRMGGAVRHCPQPHPCLPLLLQRASAPLSLAPTHVQRRLFLLFPLSIHQLFKCQDKNVPGHFPSLFNESAVPLDLQMANKHSQTDKTHALLNLSTCITLDLLALAATLEGNLICPFNQPWNWGDACVASIYNQL